MGTNSGWNARINDTLVINSIIITCISPFSKPILDFDSMSKYFHLHKHAFSQMLLMHFYMRRFHSQGDCGQSCPVQQIIMQMCIVWIFHVCICNLIKGAKLIEHFCFKCNISNSKIQIIHDNNYYNFLPSLEQ
jgi:hypothetical protein